MYFDSHFGEEAWVDFVRGIPAPHRDDMQRHLDSGCGDCLSVHEIWRLTHAVAARYAGMNPPDRAIKSVKAAFGLRVKLRSLKTLAQFASVIVDSFLQPLPVGVRGSPDTARQIVFRSATHVFDITFDKRDSTHVYLIGQGLNESEQTPAAGASVALVRGDSTILAEALANEMGEFRLEYEESVDLTLYVDVSGSSPIAVHLPDHPLSRTAPPPIENASDS